MTCKINADTSDGLKLISDTSGIIEIQANGTKSNNLSFTGRIVQTVNLRATGVATGTTLIPTDDTIPQKTEGVEYMTLAITPTHASNKLKIEVTVFMASFGVTRLTTCLFQDDTANGLAAVQTVTQAAGYEEVHSFTHYMAAGTTSETTFKVRAGGNTTNTTTFNGTAGARRYGGTAGSSITIQEIEV